MTIKMLEEEKKIDLNPENKEDSQHIEILTYSMPIDSFMGSETKKKQFEGLMDENTVSKNAFESSMKMLIEHDWINYHSMISFMIMIIKGIPLFMMSLFMIFQNCLFSILNSVTSVLYIIYEIF
jgi:hypothetical protein